MRKIKAIKLKIKPRSFSGKFKEYTDIARYYGINLEQTTKTSLQIRKATINFSKKYGYENNFMITGDITPLYKNLFFRMHDNIFYKPSIFILKTNSYFIKTTLKYQLLTR